MSTYAEVAQEFGMDLTPARQDLLKKNDVTPDEFRDRCQQMKDWKEGRTGMPAAGWFFIGVFLDGRYEWM